MDALHLDRSELFGYNQLGASAYNLLIGALLLYGFLVDGLICYFFGDLLYYAPDAFWIGVLIAYAVCVILSVVLSHSQSAVVNFIGYNLLVLPIGVMLSLTVSMLSYREVLGALLGTGVFVVLMTVASYIKPDFFLSLGHTLGVGLLVTVVAELLLYLLGFGTQWADYLVIAIFSLYLGFDWQRANRCTPTVRNAILSATQIYLDIINIFVRLLRIIARNRRN